MSGETTLSTLNGEIVKDTSINDVKNNINSNKLSDYSELILHKEIQKFNPYEIDVKVYIYKNLKNILKGKEKILGDFMFEYIGFNINVHFIETDIDKKKEKIKYLSDVIVPQLKNLKKVTKVDTYNICNNNSKQYCIGIEIEDNNDIFASCYFNKKVCKEFIKTYYPDYLSIFEKETK